ncbi:unnamed protein product [Nesidiocoris tenuis]|uniref:Uncharacterized protein n=1 Tax=Nesidiocoris tenuis TaxID=355587 RepID=A0A6H5H840_9HEMI|nr:unnamed protein product [Nesidiocoris tenuis]
MEKLEEKTGEKADFQQMGKSSVTCAQVAVCTAGRRSAPPVSTFGTKSDSGGRVTSPPRVAIYSVRHLEICQESHLGQGRDRRGGREGPGAAVALSVKEEAASSPLALVVVPCVPTSRKYEELHHTCAHYFHPITRDSLPSLILMMTLILHTNFTDTDPNGDPDLGDDPDPNPDYDTDPCPYPDHDAIQNPGPERDPYPPLVWTPETDRRRLLHCRRRRQKKKKKKKLLLQLHIFAKSLE